MRLNTIAYYADFFLSGAAILVLFSIAMLAALHHDDGAAEVATWAACALAGLAIWTLAEYAIHRFVYHRVRYFREGHEAHHAEPDAFIGAPPVVGVIFLFSVSYLPLVAFSATAASGVAAGVLTGYLGYMLVHHADHYWKSDPGTRLYRLRRHHALHHHRSEECNFGIVTSLWDHVFGTAYEPADERARHHAA